MPYVIDGDGNCHVYVDAAADLDMALDIVVNAKTQRPSVCNAAETLLVHARVAAEFLPRVAPRSTASSWSATSAPARSSAIGSPAIATDDDYATEFLDLKLAVARGRLARRRHRPHHPLRLRPQRGDRHHRPAAADRFTREVDAAAVVVNASTRFVDGEEFGFGAEIGISTQKLHARGPMGLRELTTAKYVVRGDGQIRGCQRPSELA